MKKYSIKGRDRVGKQGLFRSYVLVQQLHVVQMDAETKEDHGTAAH